MRIGPYLIERELGRGGMGVVHLARDTRLERRVAVKMLPARVAHDETSLARFRREALVLASLNHPNIAQIHSLEESEGHRHLILEYVPGEGLHERLRRGALGLTEALEVCLQVARGIRAVHEHGVIHRDLKPSNVRLTPDGIVKLIDFGLARTCADAPNDDASGRTRLEGVETGPSDDTAETVELSQAGWLLGTPTYMSPEQLRGEPASRQSDLWAFGCLLHECLTGTPVSGGSNPSEILAGIEGRPIDLSSLPDRTPPRVRRLLRHCLEREAADRLVAIDRAEREIELSLAELASEAKSVAEPGLVDPARLPRQLSSFIGRRREIGEVNDLLDAAALVTLIGPGGCGKTRLALETARRRIAERAEEVWLVELAGVSSPTPLPALLAAVLELPDNAGPTPIDAVVERLQDHAAIVLLDNCEHVLAACVELAEELLVHCPRLKILATSREPLHLPGERVYDVPPLTLPDRTGAVVARDAAASESIRLFVERARAVDPGLELTEENAPTIAAICRRLDGLPLAIELAAARARILSVQQIDARLDDAMRLLAGGPSTGSRRRHQTLEAALDWSYEALDESERGLLRAMSVFVASSTLNSATAVGAPGLDQFAVLDVLAHLVDKSLVTVLVGQGAERRYRLLETTRQYALRKLRAAGEECAVRDRHLDYFVALAEHNAQSRRADDERHRLERLDACHKDLLAALSWAADGPRASTGMRLAAASAWFWRRRGHYTVGRLALEASLRHVGRDTPPEVHARVLDGAAVLAWRQGDLAAARARHIRALRLWRRLDSPLRLADSLNGLGNVAYVQRRYRVAERLHRRALAIRKELGDDSGIGKSLTNLGNVAYEQRRYDLARSLHDESLSISRRLGDQWGVGSSLNNLGNIAYDEADYETARRLHQQSLEIKKELHDQWGIAASFVNLGNVDRATGGDRDAMRCYAESLAIWRELGDQVAFAEVLEAVAPIAARRDECDRAASLLGAAESLRTRLRCPLPTNERAHHDELVTALRESLGEAALRRAWRDGRSTDGAHMIERTQSWLRDAADETRKREATAEAQRRGGASV